MDQNGCEKNYGAYFTQSKKDCQTVFKKENPQLAALEILRIRNSEYFDEEYYRDTYPDMDATAVDPAEHYYWFGAKELRNPSELFNTKEFLEQHGKCRKNPVIECLDFQIENPSYQPPTVKRMTASQMLDRYFLNCTPLKTSVSAPLKEHRLNIIYNGFDHSAFFGGKATALLLAIVYCNRFHINLRIISQQPDPGIFGEFNKLFGLEANFDVSYFSYNSNCYLEVDPKDDFLCTMWENAFSVLNTPNITGKIFYIMQEVETFFYDHGDKALRAFQVLSDKRIIPIVNSKLLYDYLCDHGYRNVRENGCVFQPVFSHNLLKPSSESFQEKDRYKLFFYGRPGHQRNIFFFGVEVLNEAFKRGILDPEKWTITVIGDNSIPRFEFDTGVRFECRGAMSWEEYCDFLSQIDLCYSMIYTPHPSYPPLDAVSAGAVALTNRYANKQDLSNFSENIVMADLDLESMLEGLQAAIRLAQDPQRRRENFEKHTHTFGDWRENFQETTDFMREQSIK